MPSAAPYSAPPRDDRLCYTSSVAAPPPIDQPQGHDSVTGAAAVRRVYEFIRPYRRMFAVALVAVSLRALSQIVLILYAKAVFDAGSESGQGVPSLSLSLPVIGVAKIGEAATAAAMVAAVTNAIVTVMILGTISALLYAAAIYLWDRSAYKAIRDARDRMFAHANRLGIWYFDSTRTGETTSRIINDTLYLRLLTDSDLREGAAAPAMIIGGISVMMALSRPVTLWGFLITPLVIIIMTALGRRVRRITRDLQESTANLTGLLAECLSGVRVVRTLGLQQHEAGRFSGHNREVYRHAMRSTRAIAAAMPSAEWVGLVGFALVLWVGMYEVVHGRLTVPGLFALGLCMQRVGSYIAKTGRNWAKLQELGAVCDRVFRFLGIPADEMADGDSSELSVTQGQVVFENVSFAYKPGVPVLNDVSIEIRPGEVVAVVGESGSGKSTLASLLARLYEPDGGRILVDGQPIAEHSRASLRQALGVVLQDNFLFTGPVSWNIALGKPSATDEEIREAARVASAEGFVEELPQGFETVVGERGATLSGGQRQRIAIARAVIRDPRILVLDEATSSLDSEAERVVQAALNRVMVGRTTLAIAHRLSTIRGAARIYVLDHGRVVECGDHEELLARGGQYARLWALQSGSRSAADGGDQR